MPKRKRHEVATWRCHWKVIKYEDERAWKENRPYEVLEFSDNILLNAGINELWKLVTGTGGTAYNASNAYVGVGDGTTAENATQTSLQGTNKLFKIVDSGYPQVNNQTAIWQATFGGTEANFAWNEGGVANGNNPPTSGILLNRKVSSMGTKSSGQVWVLQVRITLS